MRIIAILMILTLSSCMVSQKAYDAKCADYDVQIKELKAENASWLWKDQLCREQVHILNNELKALKDSTKVIEETPPRP